MRNVCNVCRTFAGSGANVLPLRTFAKTFAPPYGDAIVANVLAPPSRDNACRTSARRSPRHVCTPAFRGRGRARQTRTGSPGPRGAPCERLSRPRSWTSGGRREGPEAGRVEGVVTYAPVPGHPCVLQAKVIATSSLFGEAPSGTKDATMRNLNNWCNCALTR